MESLVASTSNELVSAKELEVYESRIRKGTLRPLSSEAEHGPFLLFCCGDTLDDINEKTLIPKDILYATAVSYEWEKKVRSFRNENGEFDPIAIQKDLANTLLVATAMAVQSQLKDFIAGRKGASSSPLVPKNMQSLEKLMNLVNNLNNPAGVQANIGGTTIHAQQVQINNNASVSDNNHDVIEIESEEYQEARRKEREAKYKALRGEK